MERKAFLRAFIVCMGLTAVQSSNEMGPDHKGIREGIRNLFDSIGKNDMKKTEAYRNLLEREAVREQEAFDSVKDELRLTRHKNTHKEGNFYHSSDEINDKAAAILKREASESDDESDANRTSVSSHTCPTTVSDQQATTPAWKNVFHAIKRNNLAAVKQFVDSDNSTVGQVDAEKKSVALLAAELGHLPILKYFLEKNRTLLRVPDRAGNTILGQAIAKGDLEMVKYLVEVQNADITTIEHRIHTAVHVAAKEGQLPILKYFIEDRKCDINIPNHNGESPLFLAAEKPHIHIIMYLIEECHADPTITDVTKDNILYISARRGDVLVPKYLLDTKKIPLDVNWKNALGYTITNWASRFSRTEFVRYMVEEKKAHVNVPDTRKGRTPLHHAAVVNNLALCVFLVEHGAKADVSDNFGFKPEMLATEPPVCEYLTKQMSAGSGRRK